MAENEGRLALVTGASSGIGRATVVRFASEGARVVAMARNGDELARLAEELGDAAGEVVPVPGDVTREEDRQRAVATAVERFGGLDGLVNAAGIIASGSIETTSLADFDRMQDVNVRSPLRLIQIALPHLVAGKGAVVNVSSVTGTRAFPGLLSYCVSKSALDQLTRCVALELAGKGVRVNSVNPGVVRTNLHRAGGMEEGAYELFLDRSRDTHPLGRVGEPEEVADLITFLVSRRAGWITGAVYAIDGGRAETCAR